MRLDGAATFDWRVAALPSPARRFFEVVGATRELLTLIDIVATEQPREALVQLTADIPGWLRDSSAATLVAAAELCRSYGVRLGAGMLFELAAERSPNRGYLYARAAVEFASADEERAVGGVPWTGDVAQHGHPGHGHRCRSR